MTRTAALSAIAVAGAASLASPALAAAPALLAHQAPLVIDNAATAWILTSTALVLLMTLPGLALFYGGMVRKKNIISVIAQSAAAFAIVSVLWFLVGYSLSFGKGPDAVNGLIGGVQAAFLNGVTMETAHSLLPGLPELLFVSFQMTFAIITPALIAGAFAERMKFSASLLFFALWHLIVYAPICHQVWGGGYLGSLGVLDFAGGAVVHVNAGVAGLVCALVLGRATASAATTWPPPIWSTAPSAPACCWSAGSASTPGRPARPTPWPPPPPSTPFWPPPPPPWAG
jgi:ammonium transporter, Amt family